VSRDGEAFIVMEYAAGGSIDDIMTACSMTLTEEEIKHCMAWVLLGLEHLHHCDMMHRVISNVKLKHSTSADSALE
jgi:serine/threonine protein kinase